jgi:predicted phage terminase large subunit-like protein
MRYEWNRHCVTSLPWQDPRGLDDEDKPLVLIDPQNGDRYPRDDAAGAILDNEREGELMWPQRFGPTELARIESELGPYMASGRLQQKPVPDRGGIFQRAWWQLWAPANGKFPVFDYIIASLDSAFTENEQNDPSALTIWGVFTHPETKERGIMLVDAWRKWLQMHGAPTPRNENETPRIGDDQEMKHRRLLMWHRRVSSEWGLVEWVAYTCQLRHVDKLLIEAKATGITAAQELQRLHGREGWAVQLCPVKGDKVARALAVQPTFSQQMVWAPARDWSEMTIDELAVFPKGKYDDLTDSSTQALKYLRDSGLAETKAEVAAEAAERVRHKPKLVPLYQV